MGTSIPIAAYVSIERVREWYWSDPERHRVGRLDLAAARREVAHIALKSSGWMIETLAGQIGDTYHDLRDAGLQPFDDAIDTVEWLRASGCRLALLTNGSAQMQRSKIDRFGLAGLFDLILIEGEVGFGKPDPRVYKRALEAAWRRARRHVDGRRQSRMGRRRATAARHSRHLDRCSRRRIAAWSLGATGSNHSKAL